MRLAQIVAVHAPTLPQTHHLIGRRELALMRDGAGLINTARSWLVDEAALIDELRSGRISAALDVFDEEPLAPDSRCGPYLESCSPRIVPPVRAKGGCDRGGSSRTSWKPSPLTCPSCTPSIAADWIRWHEACPIAGRLRRPRSLPSICRCGRSARGRCAAELTRAR
jgi:hypothetical protein